MKTKSTQIKICKKLVKKCESKYRCSRMRFMRIMCFPVFIAAYVFDQNTNSDDNIHTLWTLPIACSLNSTWWNYGIFYLYFNTLCARLPLCECHQLHEYMANQMNIFAKLYASVSVVFIRSAHRNLFVCANKNFERNEH